ncbi:protein transport protein Sec16-like [Zootermopsis nevadensis]|uniref:Uncharacterized protein n=1 Tax=Zootermopsis nevadensis TaxID=136037 RepID=A0A067RS19_ZOONE|nr:protein transport protein Sec16-like [Zootermopsis nevadensis]KDR23530.1 hypothetical protein L798_08737 [Zootermopsis nevadensis]
MTSVGDDYSNSETLVAANTSMQQQNNYWNMSATNAEVMGCVTLPGSTSQMTLQEEPPTSQSEPSVGVKSPIKQKQKEQVSKPAGGTHSWLGGIWNRFSLRLSNQMKLPDDKNPSIVWDPDKKRWTDVNGDGGEVSGDLPLPPKTSELPIMAKSMSVSGGEGPASRSSGSNVFKLNGPGKGSKAKYLEVLEGTKTSNLAPDNYAPVIPPQASVKYLIPVPVESSDAPTDFLTSAASSTYEQTAEQSHLSRWSSTSSLSREVQKYTMRWQQNKAIQGIAAYPAPMMFDPASFTQKAGVGTISNSLKRYPN